MSVSARTTIVLATATLLASLAGCHRPSGVGTAADVNPGRDQHAANAPDLTARTGAPAASASAAAASRMPAERSAKVSPPAAPARTAGTRAPDDIRTMGAPSATLSAAIASAAPGAVDDASITRKVAAAIAADKDLRPLKIDVDTQNGIVTLSGPAPTASAKAHADEVARTVNGVVSVNNQLTLQTG